MSGKKKITIKEYAKERNMDTLATKANNCGIYTVDSMIGGTHFFFENDEVVIATSHGHIRTSLDRAEVLAEELLELIPDVRKNNRDGRTPMDSRAIGKMLAGDFV